MNKNLISASSEHIGKTVYARLKPKSDLIAGIKQACIRHGIDNAVILCCIGSLEQAVFTFGKVVKDPHAAEDKDNRLISETPVSLAGCQGIVCRNETDGELAVHLHGCVMDNNGKVMGQDFAEEGNIVFNTVDLVLADMGVELIRKPDPELPGLITWPKEAES
jgi:predicted DNA-binding protein with PD1-like motif